MTQASRLHQVRQRSRLGQLLVSKGVISEAQLNEAMARQQSSGQRLGEILTELNLATQRQINSVLRTQKQLRIAAALVTALLGPVTVFASPLAVPLGPTVSARQQGSGGMHALDEAELSEAAGRGGITQEGLMALVKDSKHGSVQPLIKLMNPLLLAFDADTTIKNVVYDADSATSVINPDGSITLRLPSSIGEIAINHIRVRGSDPGSPGFGSITLSDIDLRGTSITIGPSPRH